MLFLNYKGDLTMGSNIPLEKTGWCLLSEISYEDVFNIPKKERLRADIIFILVTSLFIFAVFFIFRYYLNKNYYFGGVK